MQSAVSTPPGHLAGGPEQATAPINMNMPRPPSAASMRRGGSSNSYGGMGWTGANSYGGMGSTGGGHTGPYNAGHTGGRSSTNPLQDVTRGSGTEDEEGNTLAYFAPLPVNREGLSFGGSGHAHDGHSRPGGPEVRLPILFSEQDHSAAVHSRQRSDPGGATRRASPRSLLRQKDPRLTAR